MKKIIISFVAGVIFATAGTAAASTIIEKVTATVRTDYSVEVDGQKVLLKNAPLAYNGSAYIAVREISNVIGKEVGFEDGVIKIDSLESASDIESKLRDKNYEKQYAEKKIADTQASIDGLTSVGGPIDRYEKLLATEFPNDEVNREYREKMLATYRSSLEEQKQLLSEWQAKLEQINTEIAELQAL